MPADSSPDPAAVAARVRAADLATSAQQLGEALLGLPVLLRPADAVAAVLAALRHRGGPGDEELAGLLADGGSGGAEHAHPLPADLGALATGGPLQTPSGLLQVPPPDSADQDPDRRRGEVRAWLAAHGWAAVPPGSG